MNYYYPFLTPRHAQIMCEQQKVFTVCACAKLPNNVFFSGIANSEETNQPVHPRMHRLIFVFAVCISY